MNWLFPPSAITWLPVVGESGVFPIHRVYCVGQNYADHAREMGADPEQVPPCFFCKPADAVMAVPESVPFPARTDSFHYEVELVVAIGRDGRDIGVAEAAGYVFGLAVGVDLTRRDLQLRAKQEGLPWETAKAFDCSAPVSAIQPVRNDLPDAAGIWLKLNGVLRQSSNIDRMIWGVPAIIAELSSLFHLRAGDLVFTGTPAGVGPLARGDRIHCGIDGVGELSLNIG